MLMRGHGGRPGMRAATCMHALSFSAGALFVVIALILSGSLTGIRVSPNVVSSPSIRHGEKAEQPDTGKVAVADNSGMGEDITHLLTPEQHRASNENMAMPHIEVQSKMTTDRKWWQFDFHGQAAFNPSMIPHPYKPDTWFAIAQRDKRHDDNEYYNAALLCEVTFNLTHMVCTQPPLSLPIAGTTSSHCDGKLAYLNNMIGPHDARIFYGPQTPYIIYGNQASGSCLGQWLQDARQLVPFFTGEGESPNTTQPFFQPTNLQRPEPQGKLEKNWFVFWSWDGDMYLHYNLTPDRSLAKMNPDGSVSELLSMTTSDKACFSRLLPKLHDNGLEWLHQSTNSLQITMCNRKDSACTPTPENTFNLVLFAKKTYYYHGVYEPYALLYRTTAPFGVHAISSKPIWYSGRGKAGGHWTDGEPAWKPKDQSQMVFTTSMSWKTKASVREGREITSGSSGRGEFHAYLDDEIIVTFGIEDQHAGGIDVVAGDLLQEIAYCDTKH